MLLQEKKTIWSRVPDIVFAIFPASCNFGSHSGCRFPCHCRDGGNCDSLTGECGGSGECERLFARYRHDRDRVDRTRMSDR